MQHEDAAYCARVIRHSALGAVIGGPTAAAVLWILAQRVPQLERLTEGADENTLPLLLIVAALLLGVWLGALAVCTFAPLPTMEEKCYGATFGCLVYLVGGVLGVLVGVRALDSGLHPVIWYLIGGTVLGAAALCLALFSPRCRPDAVHHQIADDTQASKDEQGGEERQRHTATDSHT